MPITLICARRDYAVTLPSAYQTAATGVTSIRACRALERSTLHACVLPAAHHGINRDTMMTWR